MEDSSEGKSLLETVEWFRTRISYDAQAVCEKLIEQRLFAECAEIAKVAHQAERDVNAVFRELQKAKQQRHPADFYGTFKTELLSPQPPVIQPGYDPGNSEW